MSERVRGGHSLHEAEDPSKCPAGHASWRTLVCDNETDIVECSRCGKQMESYCDFDEEYR